VKNSLATLKTSR